MHTQNINAHAEQFFFLQAKNGLRRTGGQNCVSYQILITRKIFFWLFANPEGQKTEDFKS